MPSLGLAANSLKQRWYWECADRAWPLGVSVCIFFKLINFTEKSQFVTFFKKKQRGAQAILSPPCNLTAARAEDPLPTRRSPHRSLIFNANRFIPHWPAGI